MRLFNLGRITISLIIINFVMYTLQILLGDWFTKLFSLTPALAFDGAYWQFITYMFMHSPSYIPHIMLNMFVLLIFGIRVEQTLGERNFIILYILAGLGSAGLFMFIDGFASTTMLLGASGAVFGVLAVYAFLFPRDIIWLYFIPMPAIMVLVLLAGWELLSGLLALQVGIANFGHLGGIIVGAIFAVYYRQTHKKKKSKGFEDVEFVWE
ncbi:MAG: rhomboid family intramembrane serine protease [Nanoarchaeota archaeon]